ncbi:MAG: rhomboid family intramembrane serine protease [Gammaproteobacteria bacterium]
MLSWLGNPHILLGFGVQPDSLARLDQWYRLISYQFVHANFFHLVSNMVALWLFSNPELNLTWSRYLMVFVCAGLVGALCFALLPLGGVLLVGASASVAGLMGASLVLNPGTSVSFIIIRLPIWVIILVWAATQVVALEDLLESGASNSVAYQAHLGGLVTGIVFALWFKYQQRRADADKPAGFSPENWNQ